MPVDTRAIMSALLRGQGAPSSGVTPFNINTAADAPLGGQSNPVNLAPFMQMPNISAGGGSAIDPVKLALSMKSADSSPESHAADFGGDFGTGGAGFGIGADPPPPEAAALAAGEPGTVPLGGNSAQTGGPTVREIISQLKGLFGNAPTRLR